jgi:2-dehydropantoate 2-reductase
MRIAIVGAGAIGGWIGTKLAIAGHAVSVLARGATLAALENGPWRLEAGGETLEGKVRASGDVATLGVQDLVVVALKGPALPALAPAIARLIGPDTVVLPAMNGVPWWFLLGGSGELGPTALESVDPGNAVSAAIPFAQVIGCVVHASVLARGPGDVVHKAGNRLILGKPDGATTERLEQVVAAFVEAGFDVEQSASIQRDIWYKLWGNMTMNPISAITGATADRILDDPMVNAFILRVMAETKEVGGRIGCSIDESGEDRNFVTRKLGAFRTSMLQDAEGGRPMEVDQLLGAPREIAGKLGVAVPEMDTLLGLTRLFAQTRQLYPR